MPLFLLTNMPFIFLFCCGVLFSFFFLSFFFLFLTFFFLCYYTLSVVQVLDIIKIILPYHFELIGGDLIICEEFAHMDNAVFKVVVVPTLVTGAAFIGITTLGDDDNFVSHIKRKTIDGKKPLFNCIDVSIVCDYCKKTGKELTCRHLLGDIPHWHDAVE